MCVECFAATNTIENNEPRFLRSTILKIRFNRRQPALRQTAGKRKTGVQNHNLIKVFIEKTLEQLKPNGYLFITPDNWMSYADRNVLIEIITSLQIIHWISTRQKKYFKKIGSSFTWYIIKTARSIQTSTFLEYGRKGI
jgi:hypothetical protein